MANKKLVGFLLGFLLGATPVLGALSESDKAQQVFRNLLVNPGAENGLYGMTASGGTFTRTTTAANVGTGNAAFSWDSSGASQTLTATPQTIPAGWYGKNGVLSCNIQTPSGTATHTLGLWDGTTLSQATTITSSANYARTTINFIMPSSGTLGYRFTSVASNEPAINIDDCVIGLADGYNLYQVSQASIVGTLSYAATASCSWSTTSASYGDFSADTDCPTATVTGDVSAPGTKVPHAVVSNASPGKYKLTFNFAVLDSATQNGACRIVDDLGNVASAAGGQENSPSGTAGNIQPQTLVGIITETNAGSRTFKVQCKVTGGATYSLQTSFGDFGVIVERFPTSSEIAYRPEMINWRVDANISGANPDLGTSAQSSYIGIENSSLTLTNNTSSMATILTAQIPCSSTNSPTGTTCSVGNESVGVSFTLPVAGDVEACVAFAHNQDDASNKSTPTFQIVETPNNAQTISQEGKSRIQTGRGTTATSSEFQGMNLCGTFSFSTSGQKTLRLMYEQPAAAGINTLIADAAGASGQRDIHWTVRPLTQAIPAPVLVGSVTSNSSGAERVERFEFSGSSTPYTTSCTSSPCVINRNSGGVSSVTRSSSGVYVINFSPAFSGPMTCTFMQHTASSNYSTVSGAIQTASTFTVRLNNDAGSPADGIISGICMGPR